eukprot:17406-Prorocentrum_lima.AAC.1
MAGDGTMLGYVKGQLTEAIAMHGRDYYADRMICQLTSHRCGYTRPLKQQGRLQFGKFRALMTLST